MYSVSFDGLRTNGLNGKSLEASGRTVSEGARECTGFEIVSNRQQPGLKPGRCLT
jgi:hypothetical protein